MGAFIRTGTFIRINSVFHQVSGLLDTAGYFFFLVRLSQNHIKETYSTLVAGYYVFTLAVRVSVPP